MILVDTVVVSTATRKYPIFCWVDSCRTENSRSHQPTFPWFSWAPVGSVSRIGWGLSGCLSSSWTSAMVGNCPSLVRFSAFLQGNLHLCCHKCLEAILIFWLRQPLSWLSHHMSLPYCQSQTDLWLLWLCRSTLVWGSSIVCHPTYAFRRHRSCTGWLEWWHELSWSWWCWPVPSSFFHDPSGAMTGWS